MNPARSFLYVPADRTDRLVKAASRGADAVVADLEDAVAPADKERARNHTVDWLDALKSHGPQIWVRVNADDRLADDLRAIAGHPRLQGIFLPKVDSIDHLAAAQTLTAAHYRDSPLMWAPMIESAAGLTQVLAIAQAPDVHQLHIGEMDLAADLDLAPLDGESQLSYARSLIVVASRAAGLPAPSAPVSAEIDNLDHYAASTARLRAFGYFGRDCIHPAQVSIANAAFTPTAAETTWAEEVLALAETQPGAFRDSAGAMVDEAILRRARRIITLQHPPAT